MRVIKFRVWDKVMKKMYIPQAISFDRKTSLPFAVSVPHRSWEPIAKFDILQSTGFTDQNLNEVYEGDLIQIASDIYEVVWNDTQRVYELSSHGNSSSLMITEASSGKIIGHKYLKALHS